MNEEKKSFYDHSLFEDKYFFGGYLNLAQNNINLVAKAYLERFDNPDSDKKQTFDRILDLLGNKSLADTDFNLRVDFLGRFFPFIYECDKTDRRRFCNEIRLFIKGIDALRHFYTHYYHTPPKLEEQKLGEQNFFSAINDLFLRVAKRVKDERKKPDRDDLLLSTRLKGELEMLSAQMKELLLKDQKKKKEAFDKDKIREYLYDFAFEHLILKKNEKDKEEYVVGKFYRSEWPGELPPSENGINISQNSLVFLMCLFLSKKEGEDLRAKIKGFKAKIKTGEDYPNLGSNGLKYMATHWVFSYLAFKGMKTQLVSTYTKETLLLQIADELSKVPDAVYRALPKDVQDSFIEDINEFVEEEREHRSPEESLVVHPVIRKRYENKFNYLALRYLDEFAGFPRLRFQVHLGNYVHDVRSKTIDGTNYVTERRVKEKINVFARLSEAFKYKADFLKKVKQEGNQGWELFPNPSYNIEEGNIMIFIEYKELVDNVFKARLKRSLFENTTKRKETKVSKDSLLQEMFCDKFEFKEPIAKFSLNELPALLHALLIEKKSCEEIEKKIIDRLKMQFEQLQNYSTTDEAALLKRYLPQKLRRSSPNCTYDMPKLFAAVKKEILLCDEKSAWLKKKKEEKEKEAYKNGRRRTKQQASVKRIFALTKRETGQEAAWLSDDLLRFMPVEYRMKWKGYMHSQLQQSLAFYDSRTGEAHAIIRSVWNMEDKRFNWSGEVDSVFKQRCFEDFLEKYLAVRKKYYENLANEIETSLSKRKLQKKVLKNPLVWTLFTEREFKIDSTENQKLKLLGKPLVLGRGVFDSKPIFVPGVRVEEKPDEFAKWYCAVMQSTSPYQTFYEYERDYTDLLKEEQLKPENERKKNLNKLRIEHDLYIKKLKIQDFFLKQIADKLYKDVFGYELPLGLNDFFLTREERLTRLRKADKQRQRTKGDCSDNILKETFIWDQTVAFEDEQINEPAIKLKDIGKFKRFLLDRRIETVFSYDPTKKWNKLQLERELESYERIRREVLLKNIQTLEKEILKNLGFNGTDHFAYLEQKGNPNFKHYIANGLLRHKKGIPEDEINWLLDLVEEVYEQEETRLVLKNKNVATQKGFLLIYIRNKISHNQLPTKALYELLLQQCHTQKAEEETYSEAILKCTNQLIADMKQL